RHPSTILSLCASCVSPHHPISEHKPNVCLVCGHSEWERCDLHCGDWNGKTLTFWMPLLFRPDGVQIVVMPLNLLGKQNVASLGKAGI
ncbi:hypothetical protein PAXRUDRAFT_803920, partial [Paxillus rubicundulus Ve08.2h10]